MAPGACGRAAGAETDEGKIRRVYRELALIYHPDRGGSNEAMQAINEFYERLY
jgi:curved DNA-binding protein CbpA